MFIPHAVEQYPEIVSLIHSISIPPGLRPIYGDERQLKQVVHYLVGRASRLHTGEISEKTPALHIKVCITAENMNLYERNDFSLEEGEYIRVFFKNHDRVIPPEQMEKLFEPSFSCEKYLNRKEPGLDLAICHSIIKKHSGHIAVVSEPGNGTVFDLILPAYNEGMDREYGI